MEGQSRFSRVNFFLCMTHFCHCVPDVGAFDQSGPRVEHPCCPKGGEHQIPVGLSSVDAEVSN